MSEATMFKESVAAVRHPAVVPFERRQAAPRSGDTPAAPGELFAVLWRRRSWIVLGMMFGLIGGGAFIALAAPKYTAAAQIMIDPNDLRVMGNTVTSSSTMTDANTAYVESQVRVLASDTVLRKVVEQLGLDKDIEFVPPPSALRLAREYASRAVGLSVPAVPSDPALTALQSVAKLVVARRQERTYIVDLSVTTQNAGKSALIANGIVDAYLDDQAHARTNAARRATDALSGRLIELKDRVREAEDRSETYKAQNNIVAASGQLVNEQHLTELGRQLTIANAKADEAKARLDQIERLRSGDSDAGAIAEAVQSPTVAALRAQQSEVLRRRAELTSQLGDRHPAVADVKAQARELQQSIDREVGRLANAARGDYNRARATGDALQERLDGLKKEAVTTSQSLVKLRELEREVEASRAIYQSYLTRSRETSEQERVNTANVRVLAEANLPEKRSFPPPSLVVLGAALMFGAAAGAAMGFARDWTDDRIYTRRRLEAICQYPIIAEISPLSAVLRRRSWRARLFARIRAYRKGGGVIDTLLDVPGSAFAAGIHRLLYSLRAPGRHDGPQIGLFLASGQAGARTEIAFNLALAAASAQPGVVLVDADLSRRELSGRVAGGSGAGLLDVAAGRSTIDQVLIAEPLTGLSVLRAGRAASASGQRSVTPEQVLDVLDRVRAHVVVVDGPTDRLDPCRAALATTADFIVLVVTAGISRARDIAEFQRSHDIPAGKVRGVVLVSRGEG
jgi:succinoglycan biosynthesis transport protein ExoP